MSTLREKCTFYPSVFFPSTGGGKGVLATLAPQGLCDALIPYMESITHPESIQVSRRDVAFLDDACITMDLDNIEMKFNLYVDERTGEDPTHFPYFHYGDPSIFVTLSDGSRFPIDRLSHGEKRFFCLLWYLALTTQVVIVDELANGLHHEWVELILNKCQGRQTFLAMQDPLVLDHMQLSSPEQVRSSFILCQGERDTNKRKRWRWFNPTMQEAEDLHDSWTIGIQQVHQLLRARGLW